MGEIRRDKGTGSRPRWLETSRRWQARYVGADGVRRSVYSTIPGPKGEKECARKRDEALRATEAGLTPSQQPLAEYLERYLERRSRNLSAASVARYRRLVGYHVKPTPQGRIPIARLQPDDLDDLYSGRLAAGMAPKGIELLHTLIHGALAQAATRGHVIRNAADVVERPRVRRTVPIVYDGEQLRALLDAAEGHRLGGFIALLSTVALRHGELLELRWSDVELDEGRLVLANPEKGGIPRTILLAPRAVRMLRAHRARQAADRLAAGGAYEETGYVFANRWGERGDESWNREQLRAIAKAKGLPPVTPRALRHAVATELLKRGVPMKIVQELLGHRTYKTTADVYSHVSETMQAQAVAAMSKAVGE